MHLGIASANVVGVLSLLVASSEAARAQVRTLATSVINVDSVSDWALQTIFVSIAYICSYFLTAGIFEYTNPAPKTPERQQTMLKQMYLGVQALLLCTVYAVTWMWLIEPHTPYYGYYETNEHTWGKMLASIAIYLFMFDSWFYWTHRLLHIKFFMRTIHKYHHAFVNPTAFAQDAVHPFEAVLQGPMGHYLAPLLFPIHPVVLATCGFLTSVYAIAAHDARALDFNDHVKHHHYAHCNFGLYWGFWDYVCGTRYSPQKFPKRLTAEEAIKHR